MPDFFVKNETVSGIIGNTHGVSKATKPPRKPKTKIANSPFDFVLFSARFTNHNTDNTDNQKFALLSLYLWK